MLLFLLPFKSNQYNFCCCNQRLSNNQKLTWLEFMGATVEMQSSDSKFRYSANKIRWRIRKSKNGRQGSSGRSDMRSDEVEVEEVDDDEDKSVNATV